MTETSTRPGRRVLRCGWPVLLLVLAGCSSQGTITGKVSYQGKPLPSGTVTFVPEQGGHAVSSDIHDGVYKVLKIAPGPAKIAVSIPSNPAEVVSSIQKMQPPSLRKMQPPSPEMKAASFPTKFTDPNTSGLTYTVLSGSQEFDINLPDN